MTDKAFKLAILGIKTTLLEDISREQLVAYHPEQSTFDKTVEPYFNAIRISDLMRIIDNALDVEDSNDDNA